jgi:hypothetical protein
MLSLQLKPMTIASSIIGFEPKLVPMFFCMDSIKKFKSFLQNWNSTTIVMIIVGVKGRGNNKGEKQSQIADGKREFNFFKKNLAIIS